MPVPQLTCTVLLEGEKVTEIAARLQPLVRSRATVARVAKSPVIDGTIAEGEYGGAKMNANFTDYQGRGYPEFDTSFLLAYDDKALYVAIVGEEPDPDSITTTWTGSSTMASGAPSTASGATRHGARIGKRRRTSAPIRTWSRSPYRMRRSAAPGPSPAIRGA